MLITFFLSYLSAKYPEIGGMIILGIIARNVTSPTKNELSVASYMTNPLVTNNAQDEAPAHKFAVHKTL